MRIPRQVGVFGPVLAVLGLGLAALAGSLGGTGPPESAPLTTTTTPTAVSPPKPETRTVILSGPHGSPHPVVRLVTVPNVVGLTLGQATQTLSAIGLSTGTFTFTAKPSGTSATGTVVAQAFAAGSMVPRGDVIQLAVSGY
jgi:beta-lactam-binding protein with PASTA domain